MSFANDDAHRDAVPVPHGSAYRVDAPSGSVLVTRALADEFRRVLDQFARDAGFTDQRPVTITFRPGIFGHHKEDRAADIYAVGGVRLETWKRRGDAAQARAARTAHPDERRTILERECRENLGWRLYKALQRYGRWSQPYGYPIQLFGPWTRVEGPWKYISDFLLHAHRDHIHVAK